MLFSGEKSNKMEFDGLLFFFLSTVPCFVTAGGREDSYFIIPTKCMTRGVLGNKFYCQASLIAS